MKSTMERFGIRWNGPQEPIAVPMDDGHWTPWHLANAEVERLSTRIADVERQRDEFAAAVIRYGQAGGFHDWACAQCKPNSDMLVSGFVCTFHKAKASAEAVIAEQPKEQPPDDVPAEPNPESEWDRLWRNPPGEQP